MSLVLFLLPQHVISRITHFCKQSSCYTRQHQITGETREALQRDIYTSTLRQRNNHRRKKRFGASVSMPRCCSGRRLLKSMRVSNRGGNAVTDSAWGEKRDNRMPEQFQTPLNSDIKSVREFGPPELDCIVTGELISVN